MWLTRDKGYGRNKWYTLWSRYPTKEVDGKKVDWVLFGGGLIEMFCAKLFERYTNVRLKPGEIREVESIIFKFVGADSPNQ